jgi:hypothetical protein
LRKRLRGEIPLLPIYRLPLKIIHTLVQLMLLLRIGGARGQRLQLEEECNAAESTIRAAVKPIN